jgi:hypothetical protein
VEGVECKKNGVDDDAEGESENSDSEEKGKQAYVTDVHHEIFVSYTR